MNVGLRMRLHEIPSDLSQDIIRLNELWSEGLSRFGGPFLAGEAFTAVDAFFAPVAYRIQTFGLEVSDEAQSYAQGLLNLPGMRSWTSAALAETFREADHEVEFQAIGEILQDLRQTE